MARPDRTAAFLAARPQTESQSMGAVAHTVPRSFFREIEQFLSQHLPDRGQVSSPLSIAGAAPVAQVTEAGTLTGLSIPTNQGITLYSVAEFVDTTDAYGQIMALYTAGGSTLSMDTGAAGSGRPRGIWANPTVPNQTLSSTTDTRSGKRALAMTLAADGLSGTFESSGATEATRTLAGEFTTTTSLRLSTPTASTKPIAVHAYTGVHDPTTRKAMLGWLAAEHNAVPPL